MRFQIPLRAVKNKIFGEIQGKSLNVHNQIGGDSFRAKKKAVKKAKKPENLVDFRQSMSMIIDNSEL
jgi:hypothetical protein